MLIYNVTIKITPQIHEAWVTWMQEKHIPDVMSKGCFTEYRFVRVLEIDDSEGPTYATQYFADSKANYKAHMIFRKGGSMINKAIRIQKNLKLENTINMQCNKPK